MQFDIICGYDMLVPVHISFICERIEEMQVHEYLSH